MKKAAALVVCMAIVVGCSSMAMGKAPTSDEQRHQSIEFLKNEVKDLNNGMEFLVPQLDSFEARLKKVEKNEASAPQTANFEKKLKELEARIVHGQRSANRDMSLVLLPLLDYNLDGSRSLSQKMAEVENFLLPIQVGPMDPEGFFQTLQAALNDRGWTLEIPKGGTVIVQNQPAEADATKADEALEKANEALEKANEALEKASTNEVLLRGMVSVIAAEKRDWFHSLSVRLAQKRICFASKGFTLAEFSQRGLFGENVPVDVKGLTQELSLLYKNEGLPDPEKTAIFMTYGL